MRILKVIFPIVFAFSLFYVGIGQDNSQTKPAQEKPVKEIMVYICDSKDAKVYHSSNTCSGINKCKHPVLEVTQKQAINKYGRRACKICYSI